MTAATQRLIGSWIAGMVVGTAIIAASSPLFVRSYVPLQADSVRGVWTLPPGHTYRWRSEGYADTIIGPLGMPGKSMVWPREPDMHRVALWGDSQAEGVCVADNEKLFAQTESLSRGRLEVFPLARSGEDAADWLTEIPLVESSLELDGHVFLVVDLSDLLTASEAPLPPPSQSDVDAANASIAAKAPAFVIQAARHLLTEHDGMTPRRLRFAVGPVSETMDWGREEQTPSPSSTLPAAPPPTDDSAQRRRWRREMEAIRAASSLPIVLLYAPVEPQIVHGRIIMDTGQADEFARMKEAAESVGLVVVDTRSELSRSALQGRWPHGFQNGYIGSGHLNRDGNALIGSVLVDHLMNPSFWDLALEEPDQAIGEGN